MPFASISSVYVLEGSFGYSVECLGRSGRIAVP
jgi:hypothetical protein